MDITNGLRRAGVMTWVRARALARPTILGVAALALSACQDGFFFDPAQMRGTPIAVTYTLVDNVPAAAAAVAGMEGAAGPQLSPGAAFDKADGAQVILRAGENELFNQRLPLEAVGSDKKLSFTVEIPAGSVVQASLSLTLLRGQDQIFTGSAQAQLTPGQSAEVTVPLTAVVARVAIQGGPFVIRTLGSTLRLTAAGLFATGDVAGPVTPTFLALTPNVTVAADGTVTAVTNGSGRVAATHLGRADTVTILVEDRCFGPFTNIAIGQTVSGALEQHDCLDAPNNSYNDWYFLSLTAPTLFRVTLRANGFEPFVGMNLGAARTVFGVAADQGSEVVSEYYLPAGGGFLPRAGSRARASGPAPTGSYTLSLQQVSEPQAGCWQGANSVMSTWMRPGMQLSGRIAADDCQSPPGTYFDIYGVRFAPGDTGVVRISGDFPVRTSYGADDRTATGDGRPVWWAFTNPQDVSHYFRLLSPGVFGNYDIRVNRGIPADYDACANPGINLPIGAAGSPTTKSGRLQRRIDCEAGDRVRDSYLANAPAAPFRTTLTSTGFNPFIVSHDGTVQKAGRSSAASAVIAEHVYPAGKQYEIRVLPVALTSSGGAVEGTYTLVAEEVSEPQNGCFSGAVNSAFVDFGSVAHGRITPNDCRDLFAPDTATVTRWVDGYAILLQEGQSVTVTFTADFTANFVRWVGASYAQGHFGVLPGETRSFTVTQGAGAAFHAFYAISGQHQATGSYTMTFSGGPGGAPPSSVSGSGRTESPVLALPDRR